MSEKVMKCRLCGQLYEFCAFMVGDQTVCGDCRAEAKRNSSVRRGAGPPLADNHPLAPRDVWRRGA